MEKEGGRRKDKNFRSLEVRRKYIALKKLHCASVIRKGTHCQCYCNEKSRYVVTIVISSYYVELESLLLDDLFMTSIKIAGNN